ncbi:MAG: zf-HC2 domain-containing protein [Oscillospiraceae bacterium]|nr:zf-HC2 domain-containing protein [Oscillospiraceae bacterium]
MRECTEYWELISAALDGALTSEEERQLEAHLATCPDCRALLEELRAAEADLAAPIAPPSGFADGLMARVATAEQEIPFTDLPQDRAPKQAARSRMKQWWKPVGTVAALAACFLLILGVGRIVNLSGVWRSNSTAGQSEPAAANTADTAPESAAAVAEEQESRESKADLPLPEEAPAAAEPIAPGNMKDAEPMDGAPAEDAVVESAASSSDAAEEPWLYLDGVLYFPTETEVMHLDNGYQLAGTLPEEAASDPALSGLEYYTDPQDPSQLYLLIDGRYQLWKTE